MDSKRYMEIADELNASGYKIDVMTDADWRDYTGPKNAYPDSSHEVRVTSATGGQKGRKLAEVGALDPTALYTVGEVAGFGTRKYSRGNYLLGYEWSASFDALMRHLLQFWSGQDNDDESGLPHVAHAAWHCLALLAFLQRHIGTDDRPVAPHLP